MINEQQSALQSMITADVKAAVEDGSKSLEEDWKNVEAEPCRVCFTTGVDSENHIKKCIACNGTRKDYTLEYGVEGGKIFARAHQHGMEAYVELCAGYREAERQNTKAHHDTMGLELYKAPSIVRLELMARGVPFDKLEAAGEYMEICREMEKVFGNTFFVTNLRPWAKSGSKKQES